MNVVVINATTHETIGVIKAEVTDPPYINTYFVEYDENNPSEQGNIYDANTNTFILSPQQEDEYRTKYAIEYAILLEDAWGT